MNFFKYFFQGIGFITLLGIFSWIGRILSWIGRILSWIGRWIGRCFSRIKGFLSFVFQEIEAHIYAFITVLTSLLIISVVGSCIIAPDAAKDILTGIFEGSLKYILILSKNIVSFLHHFLNFIPDINIDPTPTPTVPPTPTPTKLSSIVVDVRRIKIPFPGEAIKIFIFTLVVSALTGVFPITFLAYNYSRKPSQIRRFEEELKLFGLVTEKQPDTKELLELYNTFYSPPQFLSFIFLIIGISTIVFAVYYIERTGQSSDLFNKLLPPAQIEILFYTFLGAYFFAVQYVIRRYSTFDLQPQVFASIILRILSSGIIIFAVTALLVVPQALLPSRGSPSPSPVSSPSVSSSLSASSPTPNPQVAPTTSNNQPVGQNIDRQEQSLDARNFNLLTWQILAFVIGAFPNQGFRWIMLATSRAFRDPNASQLNERPLRKIFGINAWHEARLEEVGIDDIQNLATADIRKLLLTTQFDTMEIANWIDQAILHMKAGLKVEQYIAFQITTYHELRTVLKRIEPAITKTTSSDHQDHDQDSQNGQSEEVLDKLSNMEKLIKQSTQKSSHQEEYNKLANALGLLSIAELERLCDFSNYPNYIHVEEYYRNIDDVTRKRAEQGTEEIISGIGSGGKVINLNQSASRNKTQNDFNGDQTSHREKVLRTARVLEKKLLTGHQTTKDINRLGILWYELGRLDDALEAYNRAINNIVDTEPQSPQSALLSKVYSNRSLVYLKLGNQELETVQGDVETVQPAVQSEGESAEKKKEPANKKEEFAKKEELAKKKARRRYEKAISDNQHAIELDPYNAEAFNAVALAYIKQGDFMLGRENLEKALNLDDCFAPAYYNRGTLFNTLAKESEDFKKAAHDFERAYLLGYRKVALWANWGLALLSQGNYKEAIEKFSRAISLDPENSADSYGKRGYAYMQLGMQLGQRKGSKKDKVVSQETYERS